MVCSVEWCDREEQFKSPFCNRHYIQNRRHGRTFKTHNDAPTIEYLDDGVRVVFVNGLEILVDASDLPSVLKHNWYLFAGRYAGARLTLGSKKCTSLHRYLMNPSGNNTVDHINGDGLDNRRANLRVCKHRENCRNTNARGYYFASREQKWCVHIQVDGRKKHIGYFDNETDALNARIKAEKKYYGKYAFANSGRVRKC